MNRSYKPSKHNTIKGFIFYGEDGKPQGTFLDADSFIKVEWKDWMGIKTEEDK